MRWAILAGYFFCVVGGAEAAGDGEVSRAVLNEINLARTDPVGYADHLRHLRGSFRGRDYRLNARTYVTTEEGVAAVDEAIGFLSRQKPLRELSWSAGLAAAARDLVVETGATGTTGHWGRKNGGPRDRIERHGAWSGEIGEVIGYGPTQARLMVIQLIIDDGVPDRGHRKDIFTPVFTKGGAACGHHAILRYMCVVDFASSYRER